MSPPYIAEIFSRTRRTSSTAVGSSGSFEFEKPNRGALSKVNETPFGTVPLWVPQIFDIVRRRGRETK
jgi:hypothetical protein